MLVGDKDPRYDDQYPAKLGFVFFLVPRAEVDFIKQGKNIAINTNFATIRAPKSLALMQHLVMAADGFMNLLDTAAKGK